MNIFRLKEGSALDSKLVLQWNISNIGSWTSFIKGLDDNIIDVKFERMHTDITFITFKSEEHKTWFILRYS